VNPATDQGRPSLAASRPIGLKGGTGTSRGYDGPEIDDFRDSGWGRERDNSSPVT